MRWRHLGPKPTIGRRPRHLEALKFTLTVQHTLAEILPGPGRLPNIQAPSHLLCSFFFLLRSAFVTDCQLDIGLGPSKLAFKKKKQNLLSVFSGQWKYLIGYYPWWWLHFIIHTSKPRGCAIPRENPTVNYGLGMTMMCQCRLINCNKCTPPWGTENEGGCALCRDREWMETHCTSARFYCGPKTCTSAWFYHDPKTPLKIRIF